mmetsp:Transcript_35287/g.76266  ORF Transcript_35287/g.76266 Transcript_35287/m.76266 type:complete len:83 (+) Transcript_35287:1428-1676(+)
MVNVQNIKHSQCSRDILDYFDPKENQTLRILHIKHDQIWKNQPNTRLRLPLLLYDQCCREVAKLVPLQIQTVSQWCAQSNAE